MDSLHPDQAARASGRGGRFLSRAAQALEHRRELEESSAKLEEERCAKFLAADLEIDDVRRRLAAFHPMLEQEYFIETDETSDFYDIVCDHAMARKSGLYVIGEFRVGKTTAIENAIERLRRDMPWIAVFYYSAERNPRQSRTAFCGDILLSFKCLTSKYQDSQDQLARFMMAGAVEAGSRTCLLFIDEAQMFGVSHLRYLLELWNELRRDKFLLITVLVGQEGLEPLRMLTAEEDHGAVVARFMVKNYRLGGLHRLADLQKYLAAYDSKLTFPNGTWPYCRFFCLKAFDAGWRLEFEAERLWQVLVNHSNAPDRMLEYTGFRLAFTNDAIHAFLLDSMRADGTTFKGSKKAWQDAVVQAAESDLFIGRDCRSR